MYSLYLMSAINAVSRRNEPHIVSSSLYIVDRLNNAKTENFGFNEHHIIIMLRADEMQ